MLFYTVLFSLGEPKQNLYVQMLLLHLTALRRTETLKADDTFYVLTDPDTAGFLRLNTDLGRNVKLLVMPEKPANTNAGMLWKYGFPQFLDTTGKLVVYLDLDMLSWQKLDYDSFPLAQDTLAVYPEGPPTDKNYCGSDPLPLNAGVSGGYFIYRYGPRVAALFSDVIKRMVAQKEVFYTLDQPAFNHCVAKHHLCCTFINPVSVSFNGNTNQQTAAFYNCCGDPGDGHFHFQKMLQFFLRRFVA